MTPEERALAAAFLAECWPTVREPSRHERQEKRKDDRRTQKQVEEWSVQLSGSPQAVAS